MRRLLLSILGVCGLGLAGCDHVCSHGICDCFYDDHCCTRAPWVKYGPAPAVLGAPVGSVPMAPMVPLAPVTPVAPPPAKGM